MKFAREIVYSRYLLLMALALALVAIAGFRIGMEKQRSHESLLQVSNSMARIQTDATSYLLAYVQSGYVRDLQKFRSESHPIVEFARIINTMEPSGGHAGGQGIEEVFILAGINTEEITRISKNGSWNALTDSESRAWKGVLHHHYKSFDLSRRLLRDHVYGRMDESRTRTYLEELRALNQVLSEYQYRYEVEVQNEKDVIARWTRRIVSFVVMAGFFVIGFIGFYVESRWKHHEERLQKSRERYQKLMEQSGTGMIQVSSGGELTWASKVAADIFGCESVEAFLDSVTNFERVFIDPERKAEFKTLLNETGMLQNFMFRAARNDGKPMWLLCNARTIRDSTGAIKYYEASFQDYTTYRKNNQDLHYLAGVLRGLAFSIYQLLLVKDYQKAVNELIKIIGKAAEIDRVSIYRFEEAPRDGGQMKFEWVKYDSLSAINDKMTSMVRFHQMDPELFEKIEQGKVVQVISRDLEDNKLQEYLKQLKIHVTMMAPFFVGEKLKGVIAFDNCSDDEKWNSEIRHVLKTIAGALGHHEQKAQMELQLVETKDRYRSLVATIRDAVFQVDDEGVIQFVNTAWSRIVGYDVAECTGKELYGFVHYDDRESMQEDFKGILKSGKETLQKEYRLIARDSRTRWLECTCMVMKDPKSGSRHIYGTMHDVTELKKIQKEWTQSTRKLESLIESLPLAVSGIESDGKVTLWNRMAEETYGWKRKEVLGKDAPEVPDAYKEAHLELIDRVLSGEEAEAMEVERRRKNGSSVHIRLSASPLFDSTSKVEQVLFFAKDISQEKMSREAIRKSLKEKDVLLSEIHHRVKNNMAVISGLLSLKAQEQSDPKMASLLKESENRIRSMAMIHEKLYQTDTFAEVEFGSYLQDLMQHISNQYSDSGLSVETSVQSDSIYLEISQAVPCGLLMNELITNGFKHAFSGREEGIIEISMRSKGELCEVYYKDNGVGLPEGALNGKGEASLGLNLIRGLAKQLKGNLEFGNDDGAYFVVKFKVI
ncbi:PAS domain S-box protein [Balneolaceae bacterium ANBcel3]|nr:PAS domain S-box protein [Balneolaceae bacterium ANBcel3]